MKDIREVVKTGEIIEQYPDDYPFPSCLIMGYTADKRSIHVVMSANPKLGMTNAFDVIDKVKGKTRGIGVILCMYSSPLWLKENIVALSIEYI